jgi:HD superfamily phosphohydrolase
VLIYFTRHREETLLRFDSQTLFDSLENPPTTFAANNMQTHPSMPNSTPAPLQRDRASAFGLTAEIERDQYQGRQNYLEFAGKRDQVRLIRSATDPLHGIDLNRANPLHRPIMDLMDTPAIQRMKKISQLSAASWVYPDALQPRFGHVVGSACLTADILENISYSVTPQVRSEIEVWGPAVVAFAMTHDIGHIAPGSHVAHRVWFPGKPDAHEAMSHHLIKSDPGFRSALERCLGADGAMMLDKIVVEAPSVPKWTWQIITAGGWNTDRGDWVRRDGIFTGVQYGHYDLAIIRKYLTISDTGEFVIKETGVAALEPFFTSRANLYRNVYRHPTCRIGELMQERIGQRARELHNSGQLEFCDEVMNKVLQAKDGFELSGDTILEMVEPWWEYHLMQWARSEDTTLRELSQRVIRRQSFRRFEAVDENREILRKMVETSSLDPNYFYWEAQPAPVNLKKDLRTAIKVLQRDGTLVPLEQYSSFMGALAKLEQLPAEGFIAIPQDIFRHHRSH